MPDLDGGALIATDLVMLAQFDFPRTVEDKVSQQHTQVLLGTCVPFANFTQNGLVARRHAG